MTPTTDFPHLIGSVNWTPGLNPKLSLPVLTRSLALLRQAFPATFIPDPEFAWTMLCDLPDVWVEHAALMLTETKRGGSPGTNWIATLRRAVIEQWIRGN